MSRYPLNAFLKLPAAHRIEFGGTTEIAAAFLPSALSAVIRIGKPRKRLGLRQRRALPSKRCAASG